MTGTQLTTLADFLFKRIVEDEADADELARQHDRWEREQRRNGADGSQGSIVASLIDPVRLLAECDTRKRIVEVHAVVPAAPLGPNSGLMICLGCGDLAPCMTVRLLALPYVQHPDYQKVWLP